VLHRPSYANVAASLALSITPKRSLATLAVIGGLLAVAGPASASQTHAGCTRMGNADYCLASANGILLLHGDFAT
jgi:hypothetical protein